MWRLLGAPLDSSASGRGEERGPAALRRAGIAEAFEAEDAGDVTGRLSDGHQDPENSVIAFAELAAESARLGDAVALTCEKGDRPLVIGGDCTLLLGAIAGARKHTETIGLWFIDGHADYLDGASSETGEAADMELAILTGTEPVGLADLGPPPPMLDPGKVVILGRRRSGRMWRGSWSGCRRNSHISLPARSPSAVLRRLPMSGNGGWRRWVRAGSISISMPSTRPRCRA